MAYDPERTATSSLVLGILSIVFGLLGMSLIGTILGIIGIVQGAKTKDLESNGRAGFTCSIIGTIISSFALVLAIVLLGAFVLPMFCIPFFFWF